MTLDLTGTPEVTTDSGRWHAVASVPDGPISAVTGAIAELIPPVLQRFRPLAVIRQPRSHHNRQEQARRKIDLYDAAWGVRFVVYATGARLTEK